jgi:hypothetical protein
MRYWTFAAPIALSVIPATAHAADCQPAFIDGDQAVIIDGVEIEPGGRATQTFQVRVQNEAGPGGGAPGGSSGMSGPPGGGPCEATIRISRVGAARDPDFPAYALSAPGNQQIEILPDIASGGTTDSDVRIANAPPGPQGRDVPFQIAVPTEWGLGAGTFTEQLQLSLIDKNGDIADRSTLTVTIVIPSAASLRLVGAVVGGQGSGPAQVDLGNLSSSSETHSQPFGALIFSTAPYAVRFGSANLGNLLHEQKREQIPYRLFFDGALVDLAGANEFFYPLRTPKSGDRRPMSIVVPPVAALAGRYSDRITVTVTAL